MLAPNATPRFLRGRAQRGFTLVELMVSLVIGLLVGLTALSSAQFFMGMQRQTLGLSSSLASAASALETIKQEVSHAGAGLYAKGRLTCASVNLSVGTDTRLHGALMPVQISESATGAVLRVGYATALESAAPVALSADASSESAQVDLETYSSASVGQAVMLAPAINDGEPCNVRSVTGLLAGAGGAQSLLLEPAGVHNQGTFASQAYPRGSSLVLLGSLQVTEFSLTNAGDLLMDRPLDKVSVVLAKNVVAMVAQYGIPAPGSNAIAGWRYPRNYPSLVSGVENWEAPQAWVVPGGEPRVHAVRVSVLVRSSQLDKKVKGTCITTADMPSLLGVPLGAEVPGDQGLESGATVTKALTGDWQCYRYQESTMVVPLRNLVLNEASSGA